MASLFACVAILAPTASAQEDPFLSGVRPTEPLAAADQQQTFHLPPGFAIQLVASEPEIQKPMNMAFDARGRLWVSGSVEYPYAAPLDRPGQDTIKILEDADGDGRADKITTFADGLNIPIGLYPCQGGAIAFSIPYIYYLQDTDGDDRADRREILYGPLDYQRDTHGLNNAFRRGFDGWLYVCHGFNNQSTIQGKDGNQVRMQSGNTYRIRLDGSRAEQFTWGQVNPFGMTFDPRGDLFNADCHTKPITLLLRGGYYESFGKPHDGLGFVPPAMQHSHGSTAIAGTTYYSGQQFPPEYRDSLFVGNVMTSRVHRDTLAFHGATIKAVEQPDFVTTDDSWFRPVDLQVGPDGALYIADFYNRIIGHYEVPLDHPGRDRHRGRIWRVVYVGEGNQPAADHSSPNLAAATTEHLISALASDNLTLRMRATDELTDRIGAPAVPALEAAARTMDIATVRVHALWALHRFGKLAPELLAAAAGDDDPLVRMHSMRMLAESEDLSDELCRLAVAGLSDADALVRRWAADAVGQHPRYENIDPLLTLLRETPSADEHLRHMVRLALRNHFRQDGYLARWRTSGSGVDDFRQVAGVALAVASEEAASFLVDYVGRLAAKDEPLAAYLAHAARYLPGDQVDGLAALVQERAAGDLEWQLSLLVSVRGGLSQRGLRPSEAVRDWGTTLATRLIESIDEDSLSWSNSPLPDAAPGTDGNPWHFERRNSADGVEGDMFLSSLPGGERQTGVLRSRTFAIPPAMHFYICGHLGFPDQPEIPKNLARLRLADDDQMIAQALAPRNDVAQLVEWKLDQFAGREGYLEVVDGIDIGAYAWVAVGRFDPPVVRLGELGPGQVARRLQSAALIAETLELMQLRPALTELVLADYVEPAARAAAARALLACEPSEVLGVLVPLVGEAAVSASLRTAICRALAERSADSTDDLLSETMRSVPLRLQTELADRLASSRAGAEALVSLVRQGHASARLLQSAVLRDKLLAAGSPDLEKQIDALTALLSPLAEETERLLAERRAGYAAAEASPQRGSALFTKHCAACHQIAGRGAVIGPQLDGIGNRGLERLFEDLLDPNRNVDAAFRATTYELDDGRILVGLLRRQEGQNLVIADPTGKEATVPVESVVEQQTSNNSLMPDNLSTLLAASELNDLAAYLLSQRQAAASPVLNELPSSGPASAKP